MGQQNSKSSSSPEFEPPSALIHPNLPFSAFSSPGPDPFHHSPPPTHRITSPQPPPSSPAFYHAPHSAPVVPVSIRPKGLIRSLSAKRRGDSRRPSEPEPELPSMGSIKALRTPGQVDLKTSMKEFEALVQKAEMNAGIRPASPHENEVSSTFPKRSQHSKRPSIHKANFDNSPIPKLSATPAYLRPTPYRRNSSASSIHSSRVSIKSARRAEREWRAKVAALSSGFSPSTSSLLNSNTSPKAPMRKGGPVPPKRTPMSTSAHAMSQTSRSTSPLNTEEEGTVIVTPPHSAPNSFGIPLSNKSFETLGHYPNSSTVLDSPTPGATTMEDWEARERKPSVPHSAYSSVYSTMKNEDGLARPISFASGQWLAPVNSSPLKIQVNAEQDESEVGLLTPNSVCVNGTPTPTATSVDSPHRENLPPFESFKSSPRMVGVPVLPQVETPRKESEKKHQSLPSPPRPTTLQNRRPSLHIPSSLEIPNSPPTLPPFAFSAPSSPGLVTPTKPILSTPIRNLPSSDEPQTPYSPTTAYILSAPDPSIDQLAYSSFANSPIKQSKGEDEPKTPVKKHPFTFGAKPSPEPISMSRDPTGGSSGIGPLRSEVNQNIGMGVIPRRKSVDPFIPRQLPSAGTALKPKHHIQNLPLVSMKANIIGNNDGRYAKEPGLKRLRGRVDLTPGMENGCRPPKSGLPMADLERWLHNTSI
ncbi:hypothetical protein I302_107859 [Kwoniella bestiolae CBS 10118]|uniref:Uncharacterized protein n=1 Tax=Kwoniella bestiolae CBS 10118 TaxID=1296100 RepID=A0AAJ8KDU6_9TREE